MYNLNKANNKRFTMRDYFRKTNRDLLLEKIEKGEDFEFPTRGYTNTRIGHNLIVLTKPSPLSSVIHSHTMHNDINFSVKLIIHLIKKGEPINPVFFPDNYYNISPLCLAIIDPVSYSDQKIRPFEIIQCLVELGADINAINYSCTGFPFECKSALDAAKLYRPSLVYYLQKNNTPQKNCEYTYNRISLLLEPSAKMSLWLFELFVGNKCKQLLSYGDEHGCKDKYITLFYKWYSFLKDKNATRKFKKNETPEMLSYCLDIAQDTQKLIQKELTLLNFKGKTTDAYIKNNIPKEMSLDEIRQAKLKHLGG